MSVDLYEQYKEALRRGHMALANGDLDDARTAYDLAISLAPDRALPHVGLGQVLLRSGDIAEALTSFETALVRAPRDEVGLRGRAEAFARLGRRTDAADTLDVLSDVQEATGRLGDACETTRRALDLAEQKGRRRRLQDLTRRLRLSPSEQPGDIALAKALRPLGLSDTGSGGPAMDGDEDVEDDPPVGERAATGGRGRRRGATAAAVRQPEPEPEAPPDPIALIAEAEAALDAGNTGSARLAYLAAASAFALYGLPTAALDACYVTLAFAPDDADVHLQLVELYLELGWNAPAADKLALLARLTALDNRQGHARARIVGLAADHFPDDPRLRSLSA